MKKEMRRERERKKYYLKISHLNLETLCSNYKTDIAPGFTSDCHGRCFEVDVSSKSQKMSGIDTERIPS